MSARGVLTEEARDRLLETLRVRFEANPGRHDGVEWPEVRARLDGAPDALQSLHQMEESGGEPDVVGRDPDGGGFVFVDCAEQSPQGRRSLCYDAEALASRKKHKPENSAVEVATGMGIELLSGEEYHRLQELGPFDTKTSSWLRTPPEIRELGGAIFGDYRYGTVFIYHNGAESYYAARGFRGRLVV